jgi:hypothetical protein
MLSITAALLRLITDDYCPAIDWLADGRSVSTLMATALSRGQMEVGCEIPFALFRCVCSTVKLLKCFVLNITLLHKELHFGLD